MSSPGRPRTSHSNVMRTAPVKAEVERLSGSSRVPARKTGYGVAATIALNGGGRWTQGAVRDPPSAPCLQRPSLPFQSAGQDPVRHRTPPLDALRPDHRSPMTNQPQDLLRALGSTRTRLGIVPILLGVCLLSGSCNKSVVESQPRPTNELNGDFSVQYSVQISPSRTSQYDLEVSRITFYEGYVTLAGPGGSRLLPMHNTRSLSWNNR